MRKLLIPLLFIITISAFAQDPLALSKQTTTAIQTEQAKLNSLTILSQGQSSSILTLNTKLIAANKTIDSFKVVVVKLTNTGTGPVVVTPPPVVVPPSGTVNIGDGKNPVIVDGSKTKYPLGTVIVVKPGTYSNGGITLKNLTGVTVQGTGVILDGLNQTKAGYGNNLDLTNLTNVTITGFTTQNNGYRMLTIDSRMVGLTLDKLTFNNCLQGVYWNGGSSLVWDGTDNTVNILGITISNNTFTNCGSNDLGGNVGNGQVTNMVKNLTISGNTFTGGNPLYMFSVGAVDNFQIFNNKVSGVNLGTTNDTRLFMMTGNGYAYNNTFDNYEGHAIGVWSVSFGTSVKTSHITGNTCTNGRRYSAFEFQEFAAFAIPGLTTKADLLVDGNICGNLNLDHWTEYAAAFIDCYQFGLLGGKVTLTNNTGYNWFPIPATNIFWNTALAPPAAQSGNIYTN